MFMGDTCARSLSATRRRRELLFFVRRSTGLPLTAARKEQLDLVRYAGHPHEAHRGCDGVR
jgi:hypothetical protein